MVQVPRHMLGAVLRPEMLDKLRSLEWFRDYEADVKASADAAAAANAKAVADAAKAQIDAAKAEAAVARAELAAADALAARAEFTLRADVLTDFLTIRGDKLSEHALKQIGDCRSPLMLKTWLRRAQQGETAADLFPEHGSR